MAARNMVYFNSPDSNVLSSIDLVDGSVGGAEIPDFDSLYFLTRIGNDVFVTFDADGGRVAKYLGDGQFVPPAEDPVQATPTYAPIRPQASTYAVGQNTSLVVTSGRFDSPSVQFEIRTLAPAAAVAAFTTDSFPMSGFSFQTPSGHEVTLSPGAVARSYSYGGVWCGAGNGFFKDGEWHRFESIIDSTAVPNVRRAYVVRCTWDSGSSAFAAQDATLIETTPIDDDSYIQSVGRCSSGGKVLCSRGYGVLDEDAVLDVATMTVSSLGGRYDAVTGFVTYDYSMYLFSLHSTLYSSPAAESLDYDAVRSSGISYSAVTENLVVTPGTTSPAGFLPALVDGPPNRLAFRIAEEQFGSGARKVVLISGYRDSNSVPRDLRAGFILDVGAGTVTEITNVTDLLHIVDSPYSEIDVRYATFLQRQAYKVEGTVTNGGSPYETDVMLIDNTSRRVCGRTRSVGGTYYFRCWTNGTKSVLARHPDGGYRIAASVTPAAVG